MQVEINALTALNPDYGKVRTSVNAATEALAGVEVGGMLCIKSFIDARNRPLGVPDAQMNVRMAGHRLGAKFMTRNLHDGNLIHVWRLS